VSVALAHPNRHPVPALVVHVSRRCSRHCGMCVDLPGAALQEAVPERQPDHVARRRDVSGFVRVSVALAHPNRHPVPALVVHAHLRRFVAVGTGVCVYLPPRQNAFPFERTLIMPSHNPKFTTADLTTMDFSALAALK
jgi:hypothetical protein